MTVGAKAARAKVMGKSHALGAREGGGDVPQGNTPHLPNFTIDDYLAMCRAGEAEFSLSEAARLTGMSRAYLYRCMVFASVSEEVFEEVLDDIRGKGLTSTTAVADEIKRRTGRAKQYDVCCPHCGGLLYSRNR